MEERINIILIEDNRADANLINIYLKESYNNTFFLSIAGRLDKGLELIAAHNFDIIIADLSLPDSTGINTFKEIFAAAPEIPIIVLTGLEDEMIGINTVKLGAQDFLIKGKLTSKILKRAINYSIERYKLLQALAEHKEILEEKTADLLREKQRLAQAQKLAHVGSWEWNIKESVFTCSDELYSVLDIEPGNAIGTYEEFLDFIYAEEKSAGKKIIEKSIKNFQPFDFFHTIFHRDGSQRTLHTRGELVPDAAGNIVKIAGTEQDITEQKKEEELEQLAMVATKSNNSVVIADKEGKIVWVNKGFTRLFGYKLEDVKGTYGEILRRGEKTGLSPGSEIYSNLLKEKKHLTYENKNYSKKGTEYWVLTSLTPIINEKGEVEKIISIDSDITKQKRAEEELIIANQIAEHSLYKGNKAMEELRKAKQLIEKSLKVKEQFLANMSHEIRTPMNAIIGFTNLLLKAEHSPESRQYLNAIKISGENLLVIINDVLDFSKLESGKITFESIKFQLAPLISMTVELMLPRAIEKNIQLFYHVDDKVPEYLVGDPTRLNQILINLIGNAIKFTDKGNVKIDIVLISKKEEHVELEFAVRDTGIGIEAENLTKIFESFTQASNDTTRKYGGTGLGLSITKQLVELQGGAIWVVSKVNEGSCFSFRLKFMEAHEPVKEILPDAEDATRNFSLEGVKVLLVEDNFLNQVLATKILENWKCHVEVAPNGKIAVEKVEKENFSVVLMDIQLPEMDGYEATVYIRTKLPSPRCDIPIIAMTAHALSDEKEKCLRIGMNAYISKPFDENRLLSQVHAVLSKNGKPVFSTEGKSLKQSETYTKQLIDLQYIEKISNGDTKFIIKMIAVFLSQTPNLLENMKQSLAAKDWKTLRMIAHKMKPSITFMGIRPLESIIGSIEEYALKEQFLNRLPDLLVKMDTLCQEAIKELEVEKNRIEQTVL